MLAISGQTAGPKIHTYINLTILGSLFFSVYYLCLAEPLNKLGVNWVMAVSYKIYGNFSKEIKTFYLYSLKLIS